MSILNKLSDSLSKSAYNLGKKSSEMIEINKLQLSIGKQEKEIEELCLELGYRVYMHLKKHHYITREDLDRYLSEINRLEKNIDTLEELALSMKSIYHCKDCKVEFEEDVNYCPYCGKSVIK